MTVLCGSSRLNDKASNEPTKPAPPVISIRISSHPCHAC
jgi:hypothetical protein